MNSVDKAWNSILPSCMISCQYFQYVNTLFSSLLGQDKENNQITSLKYTVITPRLINREHTANCESSSFPKGGY